jgi:NAD(P)-dependent dehydrogenase (short-subunit alcohol dehydrogenase family)
MAAYSVTKAALSYLTRILDVELRPHGIRVNAIAPQLIATAANQAAFPAEALAHAVAPEAIANVIAFLVSETSPATPPGAATIRSRVRALALRLRADLADVPPAVPRRVLGT